MKAVFEKFYFVLDVNQSSVLGITFLLKSMLMFAFTRNVLQVYIYLFMFISLC